MISETHLRLREQFHLKHGGDSECRLINGYWVYPDGARMYRDEMHGVEEPPADDHKRLSIVVAYRKLRLDQATTKFSTRKQELTAWAERAHARPQDVPAAPGDDELAELHQLRQTVRQWQRDLKEAQDQLAATAEAIRQRQNEEELARRRQAAAAAGSKIGAISI